MIDIAHEIGSSEFEPHLRRLGLPCRVRHLDSADFAWWGSGPEGECRIGVERKTVSEITGAASRGRLVGHQLPRMTERYRFRFLIVEGLTRVDPYDGILEAAKPVKDGRMSVWYPAGFGRGATFEGYFKHLMTLQLRAAIHILPTADRTGTAYALHALYRWFQTDWAKHKSHLKVDETHPDEAILDERTLRRQVLAQIPGIGWTRSAHVSKQFEGQPLADVFRWMASAAPEDWRRVLGFKDGTKTASRIVSVLRSSGEHEAKA